MHCSRRGDIILRSRHGEIVSHIHTGIFPSQRFLMRSGADQKPWTWEDELGDIMVRT